MNERTGWKRRRMGRCLLVVFIWWFMGFRMIIGSTETTLGEVIVAQLPSGQDTHGLRSGDLLVSWRLTTPSESQTHTVSSPFDVLLMARASEDLGQVLLTVRRGDHEKVLTISGSHDWEKLVRPRLEAGDEQTYALMMKSRTGTREAEARQLLIKLTDDLVARGYTSEACWFWLTLPTRGSERTGALQKAGTIAQQTHVRAWVEQHMGNHLLSLGRNKDALEAHKKSLLLRSESGAHHLLRIYSLGRLGVASYWMSDFQEASRYWQKAKTLLSPMAPGSMSLAKINSNLGQAANRMGQKHEARKLLLQSLRIKERLAPREETLANTLSNLAETERFLGNLKNAEKHALRALEIFELHDNGSGRVEALSLLGNIQLNRHNFPESKRYYSRALALHPRQDDGTAMTLYNGLGAAREELGELNQAFEDYAKAIAIAKKRGSNHLPRYLANQASLANKRGEPERARSLLTGAFTLLEKSDDKGLEALCLTVDAEASSLLGQSEAALERLNEALALRRQATPDSYALATVLLRLGLYYREREQWSQALEYLEEGIDTLERQLTLLGGGQLAGLNFRKEYPRNYKALMETHVLMGNKNEAFSVYERYRGRFLLGMLLTRDLNLFAGHPVLADRWQATVNNLVRDHRRLKDPDGPISVAEIRAEIARGYQELGRLRDELDDMSPGLAGLRFPEPLDATEIAAALDPGTLLLAYSVGEKQSTLFTIPAGDYDEPGVYRLNVGENVLANRIKHLRKAIDKGPDRAPRHQKRLYGEAAYLYEKLIGPVEDLVASAQRLLIVADGPLNQLPFATLVRSRNNGDPPQHLISWKPLHTTVSATVYCRLLNDRPGESRGLQPVGNGALQPVVGRGAGMAVFANPVHSGWPDLPRAGAEGKGIVELYGRNSRLFRGSDATETRLKALKGNAEILHFATHGYLDDQFPLESALILTPSGEHDGRLQVWEILEVHRFNASLVVLSGCGTGQGDDVGGDGLLGLTLAFQATGARSVLASLWPISDASTEKLMNRFYSNLKQGYSKDEAFRLAQMDFITGRGVKPVFSDPFHWGAFTLFGDYQQ